MMILHAPEEPLTKLHDLARMICTGAGLIRPISMKNTIEKEYKFI